MEEDAERRARELAEALYQAGTAMAETLEFDQVLQVVLDQLRRIVPYDGANILWVEGDRVTLKDLSGYESFDLSPDLIRNVTSEIAKTDHLAHIAQTRQPFFIPDTHNYPGWKIEKAFEEIRSWAGAPILINGELVAILSLDKKEANFYNEVHAGLLAAFASQASLALRNSRLYTQVQQYARRLEEAHTQSELAWLEAESRVVEVETLRQASAAVAATLNRDEAIERILEQLLRVVPYDSASVQLLQGDEFVIVGGRGLPYDQVIGWRFSIHDNVPNRVVYRQCKPLIIDDIRAAQFTGFKNPEAGHIRGWLGVPLLIQDRVVGMLALDSLNPNHFTERHANLATAFADQVAVALENAQLYQRATSNALRLEKLYQASQQIGRHLDPDQVYDAIHHAVSQLVPCEAFFVTLLDKERQEFENVYMFDKGQHWPSRRFPLSTGVAGYALTHNESLKIDDITNLDPSRFSSLLHFGDTRHSTQSVMLALMRHGGDVIGALSVQSYAPHAYTDEDLEALELLAANAAIAIENAHYYAETLKESDRRTILYEASQKMGELDLDRLHAAIHQSVARLMPCEEFVITMLEGEQVEHIYLINQQGQWTPQRVPLGSGMIGYALKKGESIRIDDTTNVDPSRFVPIQFGDPSLITHSVLVAMMRRGGKIIGAISAQAYPKSAYTEADLRTLELLAAHAAIAIDNARLFAITQRHATMDDLTSIYNRRYLMQQAQIEFDRAKQGSSAFSLIMMDVDFFKRVNDSYGHLIGDRLLRSLCQECQKHLQDTYVFGRFGGEEFVVLLPGLLLNDARLIAENLRAQLQLYRMQTSKGVVGVTVSFGVAEFTVSSASLPDAERETFTIDKLIDHADQALYAAKNAGRNRVRLYPDDVKK